MYEKMKMGLLRLKRNIGEILPYRIYKKMIIKEWFFKSEESDSYEQIKIPYKWLPDKFPVSFKTDLLVPKVDENTILYLDLWFESILITKAGADCPSNT